MSRRFTNMRTLIVSGLRLARRSEIVSRPPETQRFVAVQIELYSAVCVMPVQDLYAFESNKLEYSDSEDLEARGHYHSISVQ
jgi:hypothetical protein